jgi:c(7)-type cytochrome triheme protein
MRTLLVLFALSAGLLSTWALGAQEKKVQDKLVFITKNGNVTFDHAAHAKRAGGDCSTCHDKLFKQDAKAALNYKASIHKTAEADKSSCGSCHRPAGSAFESKSNCAKCHVKG